MHLDAPGQWHGQQPVSRTADPRVVKQDKSSRGSVDTTKTPSDPQRVRMSSGERPTGTAKDKQPDTEAYCHPPPPIAGVVCTVQQSVHCAVCKCAVVCSAICEVLVQHGVADSMGPRMPTPPPPRPQGASGQQLVAKGAALTSPWVLKALDTPWAPKAPKGNFCPLCTQTLSLNPTQSQFLTLPLPLFLALTITLTRIEYWDRAGGEGTLFRRLQRQMRYALESGWERLKRGSK